MHNLTTAGVNNASLSFARKMLAHRALALGDYCDDKIEAQFAEEKKRKRAQQYEKKKAKKKEQWEAELRAKTGVDGFQVAAPVYTCVLACTVGPG